MKKTLIFCLCVIALTACKSGIEIPEVLANHPERATFTKLDDKSNQFITLFNGTDFTGLYTYDSKRGREKGENPNYVIRDGMFCFAGADPGYVSTEKSYKNYYLRAKVRWGEKKYGSRVNSPRDSGIIYHFTEDKVWPTSFEFQVQEGDMGDIWLTGPVTCTDSKGVLYPIERQNRIVKYADGELPSGEWNQLEMICWDDQAEYFVNGVKVNDLHNLSLTEGRILFQLEYADVYYKDIELLLLK